MESLNNVQLQEVNGGIDLYWRDGLIDEAREIAGIISSWFN